MMDLEGYKKAFGHLPAQIKEAEANAEKTSRTTLSIKGQELVDSRAETRTRLYVRATGNRTGMTYTEKLDENPQQVIERAWDASQYTVNGCPQPMNDAQSMHFRSKDSSGSIDAAIRFGAEAERIAQHIGTVESVSGCTVALCERELYTVNSLGLDISYNCRWIESALHVKMKRNGSYAPGYAYASRDSLGKMDASKLAEAAAADGNLYDGGGLAPCKVQAGNYDAVLTGRVMRNIFMTAWMALSGSMMLAGQSIFPHQQGAKIGSDVLNIVNAPFHPMLGQAWYVDSEGTVCKETRLVEGGELITPLFTLASGALAGGLSTGSAGRVDRMTGSIPIALTTVPAILYVEPGGNGQEELITRMGTGMLLTYSLDLFHSVSITSGEFSIPCGGVYYENGKPVGSVSQMTVAGNIRDLFLSIEAVGNDLDFDEFYLKSYCIGSPSALVRKLTFSS